MINKRVRQHWWKYLLLTAYGFLILSPIIWLALQSFKSYFDVIAYPPRFFFSPTLKNYAEVLATEGFIKAFFDSFVVSVASVVLCVVLGAPFGYVLSRYEFKGKVDIAFFILSTRMLPAIVIIVPLLRIYNLLGINDSYVGLILSHILLNLALVVWMARAYFQGVPREIEEAAWMDGASQAKAFFTVVFPVTVPGLAATSILAFLLSWNNLLYGLTLTSFNVKPLPVFMSSGFVGYLSVNWGALSAAGIMAVIPTMIVILLAQKQLVQGLTFGAVQ